LDIKGFVEYIDPSEVRGWAFLPDAPDMRLEISVQLDGIAVASAMADLAREDLVKLGFGDGAYGFAAPLTIPVAAADLGDLKTIAIAPDGAEFPLANARLVTILAETPAPAAEPAAKAEQTGSVEDLFAEIERDAAPAAPEPAARPRKRKAAAAPEAPPPPAPVAVAPVAVAPSAVAIDPAQDILAERKADDIEAMLADLTPNGRATPPAPPPPAAAVEPDLAEEVLADLVRTTGPAAAPPADPTPAAVTGPLKVFVIGSPRSGTSVLLRAMHEIFGLPAHGESHVIPAVAHAVHHLRQHFERFQDQSEDLLIKLLPIDVIAEAIYANIRGFYSGTYGEGGFADKTPSDEAIYSVGVIPAIFPDAHIIMTRRSGIEVVESYRKKFKAGFRDACENWVRVMEGIQRARTMPIALLEVDQFDFTNATAEVSARIAAFLGQPERAGALAAFLSTSREDKLSAHDWSRRLTLTNAPWSKDEKALFAELCGPLMDAFGYPMETAG